MRILKVDGRNHFFEVIPENTEDLWHLEKVIEKGDVVSGSSTRKIKGKSEGEKAERREIFVKVEAESVEFHRFSGQLRVNGVVVGGKPEEYVELKSFHTLEVEAGKKVSVQKKALKHWQIERLENAKKASALEKLLVIVLDDEAAELALVRESGFEEKAKIPAGREGKQYQGGADKGRYFEEILKKAQEIKPDKVLVAGPGFTKDNFRKFLAERNVNLPAVFESTNSTGMTGLNELLKEGKIDAVAAEIGLGRETAAVEELLMHVGKGDGLAEYGFKETARALQAGAVGRLLVAEETLFADRAKIEALMDEAERQRVEVKIVSQAHEAGRKLQGLGGVAALLRYKLR